nr:MAG TPA: hypothetical protein [Caudoviricetes sp.]
MRHVNYVTTCTPFEYLYFTSCRYTVSKLQCIYNCIKKKITSIS